MPARTTIQRLSAIIDELMAAVEDSACSCVDTDTRNRLHAAPGRRRTDSRCIGVRLAVAADLKRRRAISIGRRQKRRAA